MKSFLLIVTCLIYSSLSFSQVAFAYDRLNNEIIDISVDNIIKVMDMPSSEFDRIIKLKGYTLNVNNDCNNYIKGNSFDGSIHEISKCSLFLVTIGWFSLENGQSNITKFIDEIEKHYAGYDSKMKLSFYQVKRNNHTYNFYFTRTQSSENIFCKKID